MLVVKKKMPMLGAVQPALSVSISDDIAQRTKILKLDNCFIDSLSTKGVFQEDYVKNSALFCQACPDPTDNGMMYPKMEKSTGQYFLQCWKCGHRKNITLDSEIKAPTKSSSVCGERGISELGNGITVYYAENMNALDGYTGVNIGDIGLIVTEKDVQFRNSLNAKYFRKAGTGAWVPLVSENTSLDDSTGFQELLMSEATNRGLNLGGVHILLSCGEGHHADTITIKTQNKGYFHFVDSTNEKNLNEDICYDENEIVINKNSEMFLLTNVDNNNPKNSTFLEINKECELDDYTDFDEQLKKKLESGLKIGHTEIIYSEVERGNGANTVSVNIGKADRRGYHFVDDAYVGEVDEAICFEDSDRIITTDHEVYNITTAGTGPNDDSWDVDELT